MLRSTLLLASSVLVACSPSIDPPMTRSCRGEYVNECRPYTYARVTGATLTPDAITLDDPSMRAHVHVDFTRCDMAPLPLHVQISAFVGGAGDASIPDPDDGGATTNARVIPLTTIGPADAGASSIDVMIDNPFFANVPAERRITLQFSTLIDDCQGEVFSIDYHTGGLVMNP